ncbi:MAG: LysR family transcriptional regulator [Formivibrio sp.]|nr:LysR family transcriptional regulator [Formivibrio sp.]
MDSRQIKYFIAVAEERNISRAAQRLHISQPPLTRSIHSLEEELGVLLFVRTSWGMELTEAGEALLNHARNIHNHMELAAEEARSQGRGEIGRLDIGVFGSPLLTDLPLILDAFGVIHPGVKMVIHNIPKEQQLEALRQGRIMIFFDRFLPDLPDLQVELVNREPIMVALNQRNPLSRHETIHFTELRGQPMIVGLARPEIESPMRKLFQLYGFEPNIVQRAGDMVSSIAMVAGGFGCAFTISSLQVLQLPNVVYRPLIADIEVMVELFCVYRKEVSSPLLTAFLETVRNYSRQHGLIAT